MTTSSQSFVGEDHQDTADRLPARPLGVNTDTPSTTGATALEKPITRQPTPLISEGGIIRGDAKCGRYLGCTGRHVINLRNKRGLPHIRLGRSVLYRAADLDKYLDARQRGDV